MINLIVYWYTEFVYSLTLNKHPEKDEIEVDELQCTKKPTFNWVEVNYLNLLNIWNIWFYVFYKKTNNLGCIVITDLKSWRIFFHL